MTPKQFSSDEVAIMMGLRSDRDGSVLVFRPTAVLRDGYIVFEAAARHVDGSQHVFRFEVLHNPETGAWQIFDDPAHVTMGIQIPGDDPFLQAAG